MISKTIKMELLLSRANPPRAFWLFSPKVNEGQNVITPQTAVLAWLLWQRREEKYCLFSLIPRFMEKKGHPQTKGRVNKKSPTTVFN